MMKPFTVPIEKKRTSRKLLEAIRLIHRGNYKIQDTIETLGPTLTTEELQTVYALHKKIMDCQILAYRVLISEKEEKKRGRR